MKKNIFYSIILSFALLGNTCINNLKGNDYSEVKISDDTKIKIEDFYQGAISIFVGNKEIGTHFEAIIYTKIDAFNFVIGHLDGSIKTYTRSPETNEWSFVEHPECHTDTITSIICFFPGQRFVTTSLDGTLKIWEKNENLEWIPVGTFENINDEEIVAEYNGESNNSDDSYQEFSGNANSISIVTTLDEYSLLIQDFVGCIKVIAWDGSRFEIISSLGVEEDITDVQDESEQNNSFNLFFADNDQKILKKGPNNFWILEAL